MNGFLGQAQGLKLEMTDYVYLITPKLFLIIVKLMCLGSPDQVCQAGGVTSKRVLCCLYFSFKKGDGLKTHKCHRKEHLAGQD